MSKDPALEVRASADFKASIGAWDVDMVTHRPDGALKSIAPLKSEKQFFGSERYVLERVEGMFGGAWHEKVTLLGFNASRGRYEYVTADNHNAVLLLYATLPGATGATECMDLFAEYVSPGDAAPRGVLLTVRTRIEVNGPDEHRLTNYYSEPGGPERNFLEYVCTRRLK